MADRNDMDLVREYADHNSEPAFAELVRRHINLVYSVALRWAGNAPDAQDVTQAVFIMLAKKSAGLRERATLSGWLYETTRFTARQLLRTRARRQAREQEACMQSTLNDPETDGVWRQLAPHLEEAMTRLNEKERTLLALRFFENKSGTETAALLGIEEWAAHKRTTRALEKLRRLFTKRGVNSTAAIIARAISANSVQTAPVALAKSVTAVALAKGATASSSTLTLIKGALKIMAWTKMKTAVIAGAAVILAVGTVTTVIVKHSSAADSVFAYKRDLSVSETASYVERTGMTPSEAAMTVFDALQRKDATAVRNFCTSGGYDAESLVKYYGGLTGLKLGKPFKGALKKDPGHPEYHGVWVPFEIQLKDGEVHKWQVALVAGRATNADSDHWYLDGGM